MNEAMEPPQQAAASSDSSVGSFWNAADQEEAESREAAEARQLIDELHELYDASELDASLEAERSVLGSPAANYLAPIDPETMAEAKRGFQQALESLPETSKEAYLQVLARAEHLIELESPLNAFGPLQPAKPTS